MKKIIIKMCCCVFLCIIVGCSNKDTGNINEKKGFDATDLGMQMTLLQDQVKEFYADIEYSYDKDDWRITYEYHFYLYATR